MKAVVLHVLEAYGRYRSVDAVTLEEAKAAAKIADLCAANAISADRLFAHWRGRLHEFTPASFPDLSFFVTTLAISQAAYSEPRTIPENVPKTTPTPQIRRALRDAGAKAATWPDLALLPVIRTAEARIAGREVYASGPIQEAVEVVESVLRRNSSK